MFVRILDFGFCKTLISSSNKLNKTSSSFVQWLFFVVPNLFYRWIFSQTFSIFLMPIYCYSQFVPNALRWIPALSENTWQFDMLVHLSMFVPACKAQNLFPTPLLLDGAFLCICPEHRLNSLSRFEYVDDTSIAHFMNRLKGLALDPNVRGIEVSYTY